MDSNHSDNLVRYLQQMEHRLNQRLEIIMAAQDDINAANVDIENLLTDLQAQSGNLSSGLSALQAEIASLESQGVDTSALNAAVAQIAPVQAALDAAAQAVVNAAPPVTGGN